MNYEKELLETIENYNTYIDIVELIDDSKLNHKEYNCELACLEQLFADLVADKKLIQKIFDGSACYVHPNVYKRFERNDKIVLLLN